jgi:hypothetical protein
VIHTQTVDKLNQMKLFGMAETIQSQLTVASSQEMTFTDLFGLVVDAEWVYRENKRMNRLLKTTVPVKVTSNGTMVAA